MKVTFPCTSHARAKLPESLRDWYSPEYKEKTHEELSAISNKLLESLTVSDETNNYVQKIACKQSESPVWHDVRSGRVTASTAHDVLHTNMEKPAESLIKKSARNQMFVTQLFPP